MTEPTLDAGVTTDIYPMPAFTTLVVANLDRPPLWTFLETAGLRVALATDDPGLLGVFPRAELAPFSSHRTRLIQEAARASFVTCAADAP